MKKRLDNLYAAGDYEGVIAAAAQLPALLKTGGAALPANVAREIEYLKAKAYFRSSHYEKRPDAIRGPHRQPRRYPTAELLYWRARTYDRLEKDDTAIGYYLDVFRAYPTDSLADDSLYLAARTLEEMKQYDEAIRYYETYLTTYSRGEEVRNVLWYIGWLYYTKKDYARAGEYFDRMATNYRDKSEYPQYLYWKARTLEKTGRTSEAIDIFKTIRKNYITTYYSYQAERRLEALGIHVERVTKKEAFDEGFWTKDFGRYDAFTSDVTDNLPPYQGAGAHDHEHGRRCGDRDRAGGGPVCGRSRSLDRSGAPVTILRGLLHADSHGRQALFAFLFQLSAGHKRCLLANEIPRGIQERGRAIRKGVRYRDLPLSIPSSGKRAFSSRG